MIRPQDATLAGYVWLPRLIDKSRAARAGTLGDLIHPCPVDQACLRRLTIDSDTFGDLVAACQTDEEVLSALRARGAPGPREAWFDVAALENSLRTVDLTGVGADPDRT